MQFNRVSIVTLITVLIYSTNLPLKVIHLEFNISL